MEYEIVKPNEFVNAGSYAIIEVDTTDRQLVDMWIAQYGSVNTRETYTIAYKSFMAYACKGIQKVTIADLQNWQSSLTGKINTRRSKVRAIQSLFGFAQKIGYIKMNPAVILRAEKEEYTSQNKVLSEEEVMRLVLSDSLSLRDETIVRCLYSSGMRVSELCDLTWKNVIAGENGKAILVIRGKGNKTRKSGISATTHAKMLELKDAGTGGDSHVFLSNLNHRMDRTTVSYLFEKLSKVLGKKVTPHFLRHSNATHSLKRGANPIDVMSQLGHSSLNTTTKYLHSDKFSSDVLAI